ncbi:MAG: ATP phosphoribosyltransferase, partial [Bacteroidales bacterium]|nr:ATP phosphoribosyltransferase [Bacteroidales bacterium]
MLTYCFFATREMCMAIIHEFSVDFIIHNNYLFNLIMNRIFLNNGDIKMPRLKMVIPKGRIYKNVINLLNDSGFGVETAERIYVPKVDDQEIEAKIMKPQNIPKLVEHGSHDVGFTGNDWVLETKADVEEVLELGFDKVNIVAAIPENLLQLDLKQQKIIVASEYENIATNFLSNKNYNFILMRTYGATEVFPPEDADMIIDNTSTGRTLKEHNLFVIHTVLESSTCFIANKQA